MRPPRGPGGRFLSGDEVAEMDRKAVMKGVGDESSDQKSMMRPGSGKALNPSDLGAKRQIKGGFQARAGEFRREPGEEVQPSAVTSKPSVS